MSIVFLWSLFKACVKSIVHGKLPCHIVMIISNNEMEPVSNCPQPGRFGSDVDIFWNIGTMNNFCEM